MFMFLGNRFSYLRKDRKIVNIYGFVNFASAYCDYVGLLRHRLLEGCCGDGRNNRVQGWFKNKIGANFCAYFIVYFFRCLNLNI